MIAARDGGRFEFPRPTFRASDDETEPLLGGSPQTHRTAWDALADVRPDPNENLEVRGKWGALLPTIPEGSNYLHHTDRGDGLPLFGWRRRYWSFLLKLAKSRPSWTVQAQPGPAIGPFHWESRRLSIRELCRIQTFPDDVKISGGRTAQQRQLGNAVPSLLAEVLGKEIGRQFLGMRPKNALRLLPPIVAPLLPRSRSGVCQCGSRGLPASTRLIPVPGKVTEPLPARRPRPDRSVGSPRYQGLKPSSERASSAARGSSKKITRSTRGLGGLDVQVLRFLD